MNDNAEKLINTIELLKLALNFYADKRNYEINRPLNDKLFSLIEMDCGVQARFALDKLEELENLSQNLEDEFVRNVTKAIENNEPTDNVLKMIEDFKNLTSEDSNV